MNELKPEDVMRAIEHCMKDRCRDCPLHYEDRDCNLGEQTLALLREKDAEIEALHRHIQYRCIFNYDGDVMEYCERTLCPNIRTESQVRSEAITEFGERLKSYFKNTVLCTERLIHHLIDKITKEMKEEADERPE